MAKGDEWCCLHPTCPVFNCPEPLCVIEYPGGIEAYLRDKTIKEALENCKDPAVEPMEYAANVLNISESAAQRRFNKARSR